MEYINANAVSKIPHKSFEGYELAAYTFIIDEEGQVVEPRVFWPSDTEGVDDMVLGALCNMPKWIPAQYSNGKKVSQQFAFTVGNMKSCVVNMLKINKVVTPASER